MKKLLLLLLLTASFSTFATVKAFPFIHCGSLTVDIEAKKLEFESYTLTLFSRLKTLIKQENGLRVENKKNYIAINKVKRDRVLLSEEIAIALFNEVLQDENFNKLCKQSPEGLSIDGIRVKVGKVTWDDEFNRVTFELFNSRNYAD